MSIYLAAPSPNPSTTHPLFKQRGILDFTHAALNQLGIHGRSFVREVAYDGYFRNIDVFLAATNRNKKLPVSTEDAELALDINSLIPYSHPKVMILPAKEFTPEQEEAFMIKAREEMPVKRVVGKTTSFILQHPDLRKSMNYVRFSKEFVQVPEDTWTPQMYVSYSVCLVVVSEFLKTNTYPAFLSADNKGNFEGADLVIGDYEDGLDGVHDGFVTPKRLKAVDTDDGEDAEMGEPEEEDIDLYRFTFQTLRQAVFVAKPSPLPLSYNLGSPAQVPKMPGRCFPYFDRMNIPDTTTIRSIISSFFIRNLGKTREDQVSNFKLFRLGWEKLAKTSEGGTIAHMLTGVKLALETQTRMFAVFRSDAYCGFVLLGALWSVTINSVTYDWMPADELRTEVMKMSSHEFAVSAISHLLSTFKMMIGGKEEEPVRVEIEEISSAVKLWKKIRERKIDGEHEEHLKRWIGLLSYSRSYRTINPENLLWLLDQLAEHSDEDLPDDAPLFIPPTFSLYQDHAFQFLCSFGPDAPSFYNSNGATYSIQREAKDDPNERQDQRGKKWLPMILVAIKSVQVAHTDLKKVMKDRAIRMDLNERAGRNRNLVVQGEKRDLVYEALRKMLNGLERVPAKRSGDTVGSASKSKRTEVSSAADILSNW